jgi:DNA-binding CsgD family transcriptional regulator
MGAKGELVGRQREMAELRSWLDATAGGAGGVGLVSGDAGIGKTRLISDVLAERGSAFLTGWGAWPEDETMPPYWPWRTALAPAGIELPTGESGGRFDIALRLAKALRRSSAGKSMALVLEDAHWADPASIRLLEVLAPLLHDTSVVVLVTYRPSDLRATNPLRQVLPALEAGRDIRAIGLRGISEPATSELLSRVTGSEPDAALAAQVHARTGGNPFFIIQVGRLRETDPATKTVPVGVRDALRRRLNRLSQPCNEALRVAAVVGDHMELRVLAATMDVPPEQLLPVLDEAVGAGIVSDGGAAGYTFNHALVRETLLDELPTQARVELHLKVGETLERLRPEAVETLAFHFGEAALAGGAARGLKYCLECAARARADRAHADEAIFLGRALQLLETEPDLGDPTSVLVARGRALYRAGDIRSAWQAAQAIAVRAQRVGSGPLLAAAATIVRGIEDIDLNRQLLRLCEQCLAEPLLIQLSRAEAIAVEAQAIICRCHLAGHLVLPVLPQRSADVLVEAEADGDPTAVALALHARQMTLRGPWDARSRLDLARRSAELARRHGDPSLEAWAGCWEVDACFQLARRPELDRAIEQLVRMGVETGEPLVRWHGMMAQASLAHVEGRFADALRLGRDAADLAAKGGHQTAAFLQLVLRSHTGLLTGDVEDLAAAVDGPVDDPHPETRAYAAMILAGLGRAEESRANHLAAVRVVTSADEGDLYQQWLCVLALTAWALGETEGIDEVRRRLEPFAGQLASTSRGQAGSLGVVDRFIGIAAALAQDREAARGHLERAIELSQLIGARPSAASSRVDLARFLFDDHQVASDRRAAELLERGLAEARDLGMKPLAAAAEKLLAKLHARPSPLSARERQVAELVAQGFSNKEIGTHLFVSERTAENHIRSILDKLGFDSRAQIAAWVGSATRSQG